MRRPTLLQVHPLDIRGTNYIVATSLVNRFPMGWIPKTQTSYQPLSSGFYSERDVSRELEQIASLGLNNIRVFGSFWAWMVDRDLYLRVLDSLCRLCSRHRLSITYCFWSSTTVTANMVPMLSATQNLGLISNARTIGHYPALLSYLAWFCADGTTGSPMPSGEPWNGGAYEEPGRELFERPFNAWAPASLVLNVRTYVEDVAHYFAGPTGRTVFQSFDLFNEPDPIFDKYGQTNVLDFIAMTRSIARAAGLVNYADTVGWGGLGKNVNTHGPRSVLPVTYVSSHIYREPAQLRSIVMQNRDLARSVGCPYVVSEFWEKRPRNPMPQPLAPYLRIMSECLVGGQMWGLIESNSFIGGLEFDGVVRPVRNYWSPGAPWYNPVPWPTTDISFINTPSTPSDITALRTWARLRSLQPALP